MRASGILMHITSLPSDYGIGTLGKEAYNFADFLSKAGQKYWQVLPIVPTSYGDSPYQSFSTFAGNPYFIDLDLLREDELLNLEDYRDMNWGNDPENVDYGTIYQSRFTVLKIAFERFLAQKENSDYIKFKEKNSFWIDGYALYMSVKAENGDRSWQEWSEDLRLRKSSCIAQAEERLAKDIEFWKFIQFKFFEQWKAFKDYVNKKGIEIIGDLPIYVALDSADVWENPKLFKLDKKLKPTEVAGCPPDYFSETGQLWGNPLYNWSVHKKTDYDWWTVRILHALSIYDTVRIDHFRGFESFYAIPAENETAMEGVWRKGPGMELFNKINACADKKPSIIAEDLGYITPQVRELLNESGYPGMKVLQFAFNAGQDNDYLPHNYDKNCICYTGTHDNDTIMGWLSQINQSDLQYVRDYTKSPFESYEDITRSLIRLAWSSTADTAITQMQDMLVLNTNARMNIPSTIGGNWQWRMRKGMASDGLAEYINSMTNFFRR